MTNFNPKPKPELDLEFEAILATPEGQRYLDADAKWRQFMETVPISSDYTGSEFWRDVGGAEVQTYLIRTYGIDKFTDLRNYVHNRVGWYS